MNPIHVAIAIGALVIFLFAIERRFPLRLARHPLRSRMLVNLAMSALALGTAFALVRPAATAAMHDAERWRFGLLQWIDVPAVPALIIAVLWFDLTFHIWHFANHRVPLLWRFHVVHHIDPDLDVSTAFRFHYGEVALSAVFRVVQIALIGASPATVLIYEFIFQANTLFHHSNVRLPFRVERALNFVLVTPRMHGIHHSIVERENSSNFSVVFSIWDRLRGTLIVNIPQREIVVGIPAYPGSADNAIGTLLVLPFRRQRDAWCLPDGSRATRDGNATARPPNLLAP